jgi:uncharacterized protein (DUF2141 family)
MKRIFNAAIAVLVCLFLTQTETFASSHREAPLISNDPLADNTDVYAFRSPTDPEKVILIANYIPFEHPAGGPNWYTFGENIRYEVRVENNGVAGDDVIYRFTFKQTNEDPTTFFRIRLGKENWKTTYMLERSTNGGSSFTTIVTDGVVPPPNIGPRSIESPVGLNASSYESLWQSRITTASSGERVFAGPIDDPFFADLGGIFDLGNIRQGAAGRDGLAKFNCHSLVLEVPIATLSKNGQPASSAANILDPNYIIGVYASASRRAITTFDENTGTEMASGDWVQVSRLGMPLTNEVIIPIGQKDEWNFTRTNNETKFEQYFVNPELALYMDDSQFGGAVPGFADLRIQTKSLGTYDFRNGQPGLYPLKGSAALAGTALDDALFGNYLLRPAAPRSVDLLPIFHTGVPNLRPYQLATGKNGNPLAAGKPFINNFLPTFGDMLRLNMAVPATPRNSADFSSLGLVQAAVLGLTNPRFNGNSNLEFIPNMDGFPNGRRLEDDVVRIELQAVSGVVLAAIGLPYDDYPGTGSLVTPQLLKVLTFNAGPMMNDTTLRSSFPFVQTPWRGFVGPQYTGASIGCTAPTFRNDGTVVRDATCGRNDGLITITSTSGTGPFMFSINGGATYVSSSAAALSFQNLAPGTYQLRLKDASGCESNIITREVRQRYGGPTFRDEVRNASCGRNDGSITIVPLTGTPPFMYSIDDGVTYVSGPATGYTFQNLAGGLYQLRVKDANGCESLGVQRYVQPNAILPTIRNDGTIVLDASCGMNDGNISIFPTSGTAPFMYSINGGATYVSGPASGFTFQNLAAGNYSLRIKDANGCESVPVVRTVRANAFGPCVTGSTSGAQSGVSSATAGGDDEIRAYPNPNKGSFRVQLTRTIGKAQVQVLDSKGMVVEQRTLSDNGGNIIDFDLSRRPKGQYLIKVFSNKGVKISKVVVQ